MRGIRRWFQGTFRPDKVETESLDTGSLENGVAGDNNTISKLSGSHIETIDASGSSVEFVNQITSTYPIYEVYCHGVNPDTDSVSLNMDVSTDGGQSWVGGTDFNWGYASVDDGGSLGGSGSSGDSKIEIIGDIGSSTERIGTSTVTIFSPQKDSQQRQIQYQSTERRGGGLHLGYSGHGWISQNVGTIDSVRFQLSSGSFDDGEFTLYGRLA